MIHILFFHYHWNSRAVILENQIHKSFIAKTWMDSVVPQIPVAHHSCYRHSML